MKKTDASALGVFFLVDIRLTFQKLNPLTPSYTILHHFKVVLILCKHRLLVSYTKPLQGYPETQEDALYEER